MTSGFIPAASAGFSQLMALHRDQTTCAVFAAGLRRAAGRRKPERPGKVVLSFYTCFGVLFCPICIFVGSMIPKIAPLVGVTLAVLASSVGWAEGPYVLGDRRALFVDELLIARREGLELRLHAPRPREMVMTFDAPWEGSGSDFERLIRDGDTIRMYYMAT